MYRFNVIDSDTHVDETEASWEYGRPEDKERMPVVGYPRNPDPKLPPTHYWIVDGKRKPRRIRDDATCGSTIGTRELRDVPERVRHMDELGVDIHVVYPTLMLVQPADHPETELAMARSYNRWMADRCEKSKGRLRWICVPPTWSMDATLEELRFAKDHGACGVMKKGDLEAGKWPADDYFYPFYEEAQRLDLAVCLHLGSGVPDSGGTKEFALGAFMRTQLPTIHGVHALIAHRIPEKYPKLRFGCIEAGASWVSFLEYDLRRRKERQQGSRLVPTDYQLGDDIFKQNRIYVTCHIDEDLRHILKHISEDNLLLGSDYSHQDQAKEHGFIQGIRARAAKGDISSAAAEKMLFDNPKTFYAL